MFSKKIIFLVSAVATLTAFSRAQATATINSDIFIATTSLQFVAPPGRYINGSKYNGSASTSDYALSATNATNATNAIYLNPLSGDSNYQLAYTADSARTNAGGWGRAVMHYTPNGQTYGIRVDRADQADLAGSASSVPCSGVTGNLVGCSDVYVNTTGDTMSGNLTVNAKVTATQFFGDGANITNVVASSIPWNNVSSKPTTLSGYGITNFYSTNSGGATAANLAVTNGVYYTTADVGLFGQTDGALFVQAYDASWVGQIYQDYRTGQIGLRGKNNGTWQPWHTVIDSTTIGSQSVNYAVSAGSATNAGSVPCSGVTGGLGCATDHLYVLRAGDTMTGNLTVNGEVLANNYGTVAGNGYGYRFWTNDAYKLDMSNDAFHQYGTVSDYSLKMTMGNGAGRGFTWGQAGVVPVASLNASSGNFQTAGSVKAPSFVGSLSGNASTATALAANGANCSLGSYPLGVDASGAVESCTAIVDTDNQQLGISGNTITLQRSGPITVPYATSASSVPCSGVTGNGVGCTDVFVNTTGDTMSGALTANANIAANAGLTQDGNTILNGTDTWLRTTGATGWYSTTYNGGWYMQSVSWIENYASKPVFISKNVNADPASTGTSQTGGALRLRGNDNAVLDFGLNSVNTWIQATDQTNLSLNYNLNLNPNGGNVGIRTSAPANTFQIGPNPASYAGNDFVASNANGGLAINNNSGSAYIYSSQRLDLIPGGNNGISILTNGNVGIGTTNATYKLTVNGNASFGAFKVTAGTFDPLYTINNKRYATYLSGMTGVKEETAGVVSLNCLSKACSTVIDFNNLTEGSDLWLFSKVTNLKNNFLALSVLLTPSVSQPTWYEKDIINNTLTIKTGNTAHRTGTIEVSYRLTAPRFDASSWKNISTEKEEGFNLDKLIK